MNEKTARRRKRDELKARIWETYLQRGRKAKEDYSETADDVLEYFKAGRTKLFDQVSKSFMKFSKSVVVPVNKAAQVRAVLGPHLYQQNPKREVNTTTRDAVKSAMAHVLAAYVNYTPNETYLSKEKRKTIDDCLLRGRGFMRTGFEPEREVVTSWYVSSKDVLIDPDATCMDDAKWVAVRRQEPVWDVKRQTKDKWRAKGLKGNLRSKDSDVYPEEILAEADDDEDTALGTNEIVRYWEIWSKMGNGLGRGLEAPAEHKNETGKDFVKLMIAPGHPVPLFEGDWEIPLYLDKDWPIVELDFVETLDELWPTSLMAQALPHQKALDLLATLALWLAKVHGSERYFVDAQLRQTELQAIKKGEPTEVIPIVLPSGKRLNDVIMRFDTGSMSSELREEREWHDREMSLITGVTSVLHSASDQMAQERSATASSMKMQAANTRLEDMRSKLEEFCSRVARHEAIAIRLPGALDEEDVQRVVKDLDLGYLVSVDAGGELAIRSRYDEEEILRAQETGERLPLTMEDILPAAATYFPDEELALVMAQQVAQALQAMAAQDPRARDVINWLSSGVGGGITVRPVTVADVWRDTAGISPREMMREYCYEVETGSTRRPDPETKVEYTESLLQNVLPVAVQAGDVQGQKWIYDRLADSFGIPEGERFPGITLPPPPPAPGQGPVPGGEQAA